ncbi:RsiV family protein [Helicobacter sp. MIT 05-5294]|uniref:RsiV family protein n=1 Tax=Helicobacter sp. MIT 05-5294 TaxID=1548150 RepID=UPI000B23F9B6|nr:RsiV family protein [Helicobacter sp. MIT 05-5294]TLD86790.1 DUF3298 domain-containing protein [Helicobacter sp. MIT 05-5294]
MKQRNFKFTTIFLALVLHFSAPSMILASNEVLDYQTFELPQTFLQSKLFTPTKKASKQKSSLLFVANSNEGILYAGNQVLGRCVPLNDAFGKLKNGTLQCKNLSLKVENGTITEAFNDKTSQKLNLKLLESFRLQSQEVLYQYPKKPKKDSTTNAQISTQFYCSKDSKIQESLEVLYGFKFDCQNAQKIFLENAKDSMQKSLESLQDEANIKGKNAIEEYLRTSSFERQDSKFLYYFDENLLVFIDSNYLYLGGAHGMPSELGVILSKNKNEILDLESIMDFQNPKLKKLLWKAYQNYQKTLGEYAPKDYVLFQDFEVSKVVSLDYDSFVFIYQPYEIMPYAYGFIRLKIPLEQMAEFVQFAKTPLESLFAK